MVTQAAQEKTTASLSIADDQIGHVIGCTGLGLKQVHDISGTKVSVSPTITANCCLITIWGTDQGVWKSSLVYFFAKKGKTKTETSLCNSKIFTKLNWTNGDWS